MGYWTQFTDFDPLAGEVPTNPLPQLRDIASRARVLLKGRSRKQLIHAAETIDWMVDEYFSQEKDAAAQRILHDGSWELGLLDEEACTERGVRNLLDNWPAEHSSREPSYCTKENTTEFEALIRCLDSYVIADDEDFPNGKPQEYFAVLALWKVADCLRWLSPTDQYRKFDESLDRFIASTLPKCGPVRFGVSQQLAVNDLMQAHEAICWAEHVAAVESLELQLTGARSELAQLRATTEEQAVSIAQKRVSVAASKAAITRHREHHAMKRDVFAWCALHLSNYRSMDSAAEAIAGPGKLVPVAVRTAREWIGEWKRDQRSARTP